MLLLDVVLEKSVRSELKLTLFTQELLFIGFVDIDDMFIQQMLCFKGSIAARAGKHFIYP